MEGVLGLVLGKRSNCTLITCNNALMAWANDHRSVSARFCEAYHFSFEGRNYSFAQDMNTLTTVYDAVSPRQSIILGTYLVRRYGTQAAARTFLELGAGTGLPSVLLATTGAAKVVATDLGPVLSPLSQSVRQNCASNINIEVKEYAWGEEPQALAGPFDVILASDVVYDFDYFPHFVRSLNALAWPETDIFVAFRERYRDVEGWFFQEVGEDFATWEVCERYEPYSLPNIRLFQLRKLPI